MKSFQDSIAWQKAMDLDVAVDIALEGNFRFKDQLFRASLSSCNNIAEGHEMPSVRHRVHQLWITTGSSNEACSTLHRAKHRSYFIPIRTKE